MTQPQKPRQLTPAGDAEVIERILHRFVNAGCEEYNALTELCDELERNNPDLSERARQAIADIRAAATDKRDDAVEAARRLSLANRIVLGNRTGKPVPRRLPARAFETLLPTLVIVAGAILVAVAFVSAMVAMR